MGQGAHFETHTCLDFLITLLKNHPLKGEALVLVALNSPVTRNRNAALQVLEAWGQDRWSMVLHEKIRRLHQIEPNENTQKNIEQLLNGEPLS